MKANLSWTMKEQCSRRRLGDNDRGTARTVAGSIRRGVWIASGNEVRRGKAILCSHCWVNILASYGAQRWRWWHSDVGGQPRGRLGTHWPLPSEHFFRASAGLIAQSPSCLVDQYVVRHRLRATMPLSRCWPCRGEGHAPTSSNGPLRADGEQLDARASAQQGRARAFANFSGRHVGTLKRSVSAMRQLRRC